MKTDWLAASRKAVLPACKLPLLTKVADLPVPALPQTPCTSGAGLQVLAARAAHTSVQGANGLLQAATSPGVHLQVPISARGIPAQIQGVCQEGWPEVGGLQSHRQLMRPPPRAEGPAGKGGHTAWRWPGVAAATSRLAL